MKYIFMFLILGAMASTLFTINLNDFRAKNNLIPKEMLRIKIGPNLKVCNTAVNGVPDLNTEIYGPWVPQNSSESAKSNTVIAYTNNALLLTTKPNEEKSRSIINYGWSGNYFFNPVFKVDDQYIQVESWETDYGVLFLYLFIAATITFICYPIWNYLKPKKLVNSLR